MADTAPNIFPALRYRDASAAIEWLCRAFGCERLMVHPDPEGTIAHAELALGAGVVMLGSTKSDPYGSRSPRELGEVSQSLYVWVPDVDAHHARRWRRGGGLPSAARHRLRLAGVQLPRP